MVGFPWVNFFMVKFSVFSLAKRRLFSDDNKASFVFSNSLMVISIPSMASLIAHNFYIKILNKII